MQIARNAGRDQCPAPLLPGEDIRVQLRHDELGRCGAVMFLGYADLIHLPEPPDLVLARLEDSEIELSNGSSGVGRGEDQAAGQMALSAEQCGQVVVRQLREWSAVLGKPT